MAGVPTLGQALNQIQRIQVQQTQYNLLSEQLATGKKTQKFGGLGTGILTSQRARADVSAISRYQENIVSADRRMQVMLNAIEEIQAQVENLAGAISLFSQESVHQQGTVVEYDNPATSITEERQMGMSLSTPESEFRDILALASDIFDIVTDLMNTKEGDNYVLGGADSLTKPLGSTSTLDSAMTFQITEWKAGNISNAELIADLTSGDTTNNSDAISDTIIGYSSTLSAGNVGDVYVRASDTVEVDYTVRANEDALRDVVVTLGFLKNASLPPIADSYIAPNAPPNAPDVQGAPGETLEEMKENFFAVFNSLSSNLTRSLDDIDSIRFRVESARARIFEIGEKHSSAKNILLATVSDVEDVDTNEAAVKLTTLQTQLETTYAITGRLQNLSLVNFI